MIVVTGVMRSGTSPLSMMLHRIGIRMGTMMRFPAPGPMGHAEWEDAPLADPLLAILEGESLQQPEDVIRSYIRSRADAFGLEWGVKTPFVLPYLDIFREKAKTFGDRARFIVTHRDFADCLESLQRQFELIPWNQRVIAEGSGKRVQARLMTARKSVYGDDVEFFDIRDTWYRPVETAKRLIDIAGIDADPAAVAAGVGRRD